MRRVLKHDEIRSVAADLGAEARKRDYVHKILAPTFLDDPTAWEMIVEVLEVVLHRRDLYIVPERLIKRPAPHA